MIHITQASLPVLVYLFYKMDVLSKLKRNGTYKWAWYIMMYGGMATYGPMVMLYPFSYMGIGPFYVKVTKAMSGFNFLYNLVVSFMFYYASKLYLYEADLKKWVISVEFYSYTIVVWVIFWMLRQAMWRDFEAFYLVGLESNTVYDINVEDQENGKEGADEEGENDTEVSEVDDENLD